DYYCALWYNSAWIF
nr:immunoglobulin light chain junction region [Macaca mulatta]MOV67157.1 immunoglobulin light chain junction region [Macaca mulatta]MOV68741.1 immunoglobulin light chain junction region [Macaca mulatta]MOV68742.1 immunoglobulin light chain junction region [Macaca mulatta]MOV70317.1 immunoglobulin light chain junction region [Macaca mulatta]